MHVFFRILAVNLFCVILVLYGHEEVKASRSKLREAICQPGRDPH